MWENDLSHKSDPRFSSPRLDVNLGDDGATFTPLESKLEEVIECPSTILPLVSPSLPSTLRDNTSFVMTFPNSPLPKVSRQSSN